MGKQFSLGKTNVCLREVMRDEKVCDNVCLCSCECLSVVFFSVLVKFPRREDLWQLPFLEVATFGQLRKAPRRLLSASIESQISSA